MESPVQHDPMKTTRVFTLKLVLGEIQAIGRETAHQTIRLALLAYGYFQLPFLRWRAYQSSLALGQRLIDVDSGDEKHRHQFKLLNDRIQAARARGIPNFSLELERRRALVQSALIMLENGTAPEGAEPQHREALEVRRALEAHRVHIQAASKALFPSTGTVWRRVGLGFATILCLLLLIIPRGSQRIALSEPKSPSVDPPLIVSVPLPPLEPTVKLDPDAPLEISPHSEIDEHLFHVRTIEDLYSQLPSPDRDSAQLSAILGRLFREANTNRHYLEAAKSGDEVISLYTDFVALLDNYTTFLVDIGRIQRESVIQAEQAVTDNVERAASTSIAAAKLAKHPAAAAIAAVVAGAGQLAWGLSESSNAIDEAKRFKEDEARRKLLRNTNDTVSKARGIIAATAHSHNWGNGEAGFETSDEQMKKALDLARVGDARELIRSAEIAVKRRPRDPFALAALSDLQANFGKPSPSHDGLMDEARKCVTAASLVPAGGFYDGYRARFLAMAGVLSNKACLHELGNRGWIVGAIPSGAESVQIWRTYLVFDPIDHSGTACEQLSWALAYAGRNDIAVKTAGEISGLRESSPDYAYNYACLLSITGSTEKSFRSLKQAFDRGYEDINWARNDPDLGSMRKARATDFKAFSSVEYSWKTDPPEMMGWRWNDVILTNRSSFPLTNVTLEITFRSAGKKEWKEQFPTPRIGRGETFKWKTKVVRGGAKGTPALTCDQNK